MEFIETAIKSADQSIALARKLMDRRYQDWIFRGQRCADWPLSSGLERMLTAPLLNKANEYEKSILEKFQRQGHQYISNPPLLEDYKDMVELLNFKKEYLRDEVAIIKVKLPPEIQYECWKDLEGMNISRASLFPGIDGFAASIKDKYSWILRQMTLVRTDEPGDQ